MTKKYLFPLAALSALGVASVAGAAQNNGMDRCAPEPAATCYPDNCKHCYCLGPENYGANAPVCPKTCDGDFFIEVSGFYWNAHQDGMEFAVDNHVAAPDATTQDETEWTAALQENNNLIDASYENPNFKWDFGFKLGVGYCMACDGWDIGAYWTWYKGKGSKHIEAEVSDNHTLLPLWSGFADVVGGALVATDIEANWNMEMNLVDIELGRNFWTSKYLSIRPHVGLRIAKIDQHYTLQHKGGSYGVLDFNTVSQPDPFNNEVNMDNDFHGVGLRAGLDSFWNLGCGWAIYGDFAAAIVYGRFDVEQDETNRLANGNHDKTKVLEINDSFRSSRAILDLGLGIQWGTMFCDCKYEFMASLGWEHHLFFNQNQLSRINRVGSENAATQPNNTGQNVYNLRRGDLDTQGWTLKLRFAF